jgi:metal-responsive CopG/Arc/MetJ family transcriptional regulator
MKKKKYVQGITFFTTERMYEELETLSDALEISLSELLRQAVKNYLREMEKLKVLDQDSD